MDADRIVRDFCALWGRGDVDGIVDAFSDDAVYHNIPMAPCEGKDAIRAFVGTMFGGMASAVEFEIKNQVVNGSLVLNERVDTIQLKTGEVALPVCGVFELAPDGKIAAWRDYFDMAQFTGQ
jgi:limonene-1,2-epoxide hydrolase